MALRWYTVVVDCLDPAAQARWWAQVLDWAIVYEADDEVVIVPPHASMDPVGPEQWRTEPPAMVFVLVPDGKTVKNRLHVDLAPHSSQDRDGEIARLIGLGATHADVGQGPDVSWTVLADPEGNEFCVLSARDR